MRILSRSRIRASKNVLSIALIVLVVAWLLVALLVTRWSAPWVFGSAMLACYLMGLVDTSTLLAKATNEGLVTLVLLILVSVGLERLPWLAMVSRKMLVPSLARSLLNLSLITATFSAFVNNTAVVATLAGTLRKSRLHRASQLLLPLSYAAILGGTLTLIGTSTNLIVSSFFEEASGQGLEFFAFLPVALPAACAGIARYDPARPPAARSAVIGGGPSTSTGSAWLLRDCRSEDPMSTSSSPRSFVTSCAPLPVSHSSFAYHDAIANH